MNEQAEKIQIVINTLQDLDIKSTFDNMNHLLACMKMLAEIRDELRKEPEINLEVVPNGETDPE